MTGEDTGDEVEGLDPREVICSTCNLARWAALPACPHCALDNAR